MHDVSKVVKRPGPRPRTGPGPALGPRPGPLRIAVIGRAGAGKTTIALALGEAFGLPVVHLDRLAWGPGWRLEPPETLAAREAPAILEERWVMDGGYLSSPALRDRVARAHVVVQAEAPLAVCLWRIARRAWWKRTPRPDLPDGCEEGLSLSFISWTVTWSWRTRRARAAIHRVTPLLRAQGAADAVARVRSVWAIAGEATHAHP